VIRFGQPPSFADGCGRVAAAAWLATGPVLNRRVRPRRVPLLAAPVPTVQQITSRCPPAARGVDTCSARMSLWHLAADHGASLGCAKVPARRTGAKAGWYQLLSVFGTPIVIGYQSREATRRRLRRVAMCGGW
jgi:hypothetical protein